VSKENKSLFKCTVTDLDVYKTVLSQPLGRGFKLKDLKLLDNCASLINSLIPPRIPRPDMPPPVNGKSYTQEEAQEHSKLLDPWLKATKTQVETEVEFELNSTYKAILVEHMLNATGFDGAEHVRKRVFDAASKLGIEL
jgi:hypothetical protein